MKNESMTFYTDYLKNSIREVRTSKGISQRELAELAKVSPAVISAWENGKKLPTLTTYRKLGRVMGVSYLDLIAEDELITQIAVMACGQLRDKGIIEKYMIYNGGLRITYVGGAQTAFRLKNEDLRAKLTEIIYNMARISLDEALSSSSKGLDNFIKDVLTSTPQQTVDRYIASLGRIYDEGLEWFCDLLDDIKGRGDEIKSYRVDTNEDYTVVFIDTKWGAYVIPLNVIGTLRNRANLESRKLLLQYFETGALWSTEHE